MRQKRQKPRRTGLIRNVLLAVVAAGALVGILYDFMNTQAAPPLPPPKPEVPILIYHSISEGQNLNVPPADFEAQMKWLADNGFKPITMHQLQQYWKGKVEVPGQPVVITFDDGYLDNYTVAFPILQKYKFPATIYIVTDSIKRDNHMKWPEMKEMHAKGIEFGSHTASHANFKHTPVEQLKVELARSKQAIEEGFGSPVTTFCYPGGGLIPEATSLVADAGYETAVTTRDAWATITEDRLLLSRVHVVGGITIEQFAKSLRK